MPKTSKKQIVDDELKVLEQLELNSNKSIDAIAKRCAFSRQKAWRIIKRLEKEQLIWGYTAITDYDKLKLSHFILLIVRSTKPLDKKITDKINTIDLVEIMEPMDVKIESSILAHGKYDWIISFTTQDIAHAKRFCNALLKHFPGAIESMELEQSLYILRKQHVLNPSRNKLQELID